ncbi:unnamed protein product [Anisakis simplex]|uniref:Glutathione S-transferase class-mu 28 kDa isozyme (inferred by orthology to a S. mansoni protein) n=1 Tax=Anisakis simplex TaxID=6269 RepID=A0A0M3KA46_ANISI|nr:unnamed protein product [Anisakis simplex]
MLVESTAIALYLAKKFGLNGQDDWEAAKIHELFGATTDFLSHAVPFYNETNEAEKQKMMAVFEKDHLEPFFTQINKVLQQNDTGFFVGEQLSVADLNMLCMIGLFSSLFPKMANNYPQLIAFKDRMMNQPNIKKWIETRPKTDL